MNISFERVTVLEYRLKAAETQLNAFRSGEKYVRMEREFQKALRKKDQRIREQDLELSRSHSETVSVRNQWFAVFEDMEMEHARELQALKKEKEQLKQKLLKTEKQRDDALDKVTEQRRRIYALETELEEEKGKNLKLRAQINRDYENSSIPSSKALNCKKISNSREKSGRKPGGQPGHKGHGRKKQELTAKPVLLPPPPEVLEDPNFKKTPKTIVKQLVNVRMVLDVAEYRADVYYNSRTGERIHATFPEGIKDDVNYGGSVKAFLFLLNNDCCTSIDKSRKFLSDLTDGKLNISKGMINKLSREFAQKTEQERKRLFSALLLSPVMHTDCTNAKENGKNVYVYVCASADGTAMYFAREKKGHEGVKGTPVEDYQGTLIHDHDRTFYNYGTAHQECLAHILRYLKDSIDNEPDRTWNRQMRGLLQEMIHYRNGQERDAKPDAEKNRSFEERYSNILRKAKEEYEYVPASDYYKDGYNLYQRMEEYKSSHLLFLTDHRVPATNNEAERLLRRYKRKQQQAVSFRGFESIEYLCECMSMLIKIRQNEEANLFNRISQIFG
ncbi:MAG: transposase [Lachnospiraceae bacterium]|nr:transposase [Lachnospiraceae bacterium]